MAILRLAAANSALALRSPSSAASTIARRRFSSAAIASRFEVLQLFDQGATRLFVFGVGRGVAGRPFSFHLRLGIGPLGDQAENLAQHGPFTLKDRRLG